MSDSHASTGSSKPLLIASAIILAAYFISAMPGLGLPQAGTRKITDAAKHHGDKHHGDTGPDAHPEEHSPTDGHDPAHEKDEHGDHEDTHSPPADAHAEDANSKDAHPGEGSRNAKHTVNGHPELWMVLPFVLLLGAIAVLPLIPATEHWWESNLNRFIVAAVLGALTLLYYLVLHEQPVEGHWPAHHVMQHSESGLNVGVAWTVLANAILNEYIPFIMLLFSLYTISGGIRIKGGLPAHPLTNSIFMAIGGLLASFIGTTGASMLLIRPLLEANKERKSVKLTVIFFIFVVCNCGGCLLPIGDPPLFLGYLRGVSFLWTMNLWPQWLFVNVSLVVMYYTLDHFWYYRHEKPMDIAIDETRVRGMKFSGLWPNVPLLMGVVLSIGLLDPSKTVPGTNGWHPWIYLREIVQLALVMLSLLLGSKAVRRANWFNYHAIIEVSALFFGIFICMQPALRILQVQGPEFRLNSPMPFFWLTGGLSAVLDNAPTYVVFFATAASINPANLPEGPMVPINQGQISEALLVAISLGAVFMGAMTYIGNGPNFMVKAIAEKSGVSMPSFFGYMLYSCAFLLPLFIITTIVFL